MKLRVELVPGIARIPAAAWDALVGQDDPFVEHAFLAALEASGTASHGSGWEPLHVVVRRGDTIVGALPLYLKDHSYGEFIFDWSWASASHRMGVPYYPKLVSMVPVTPATGTRVLLEPGAPDRVEIVRAITNGLFEAAERTGASSIHVLFLREEERDLLLAEPRLRPRLSHQFHWENPGYASFDDFVGRFRSAMRKQVRKERKRAQESGLDIRVLEGSELGDREWNALSRFYRDTCDRKGSPPYLTPELFLRLRESFAHRVVAALAYKGDAPVAGSLNFERGKHLYGRYWGCVEQYDSMHFELCYYRLIERAIAKGMTRFEAGAQGEHKLRRGLMPARVHSVHWVRDPTLRRAVDEFLPREAFAVERDIVELAPHGPFRRDGEE